MQWDHMYFRDCYIHIYESAYQQNDLLINYTVNTMFYINTVILSLNKDIKFLVSHLITIIHYNYAIFYNKLDHIKKI